MSATMSDGTRWPRWQKRAAFVRNYADTAGPRRWDDLITAGAIRTVRIGNSLLIDTESVEAYLDSLAEAQAAERAAS